MMDKSTVTDGDGCRLQLLAELSASIKAPTPTAVPPALCQRYILFFDGGARGNPGQGGAGAVIVSTDQTGTAASIVWAAAMSYRRSDMTNNRAEYLGVIAGLKAAWHHKWQPLEVVGDSALILRQLREYRTPNDVVLRALYAQARGLADKLGVAFWAHHFRAHNKMADAAANAAMDACGSIQVRFPTTKKQFADIPAHLGSSRRPSHLPNAAARAADSEADFEADSGYFLQMGQQ